MKVSSLPEGFLKASVKDSFFRKAPNASMKACLFQEAKSLCMKVPPFVEAPKRVYEASPLRAESFMKPSLFHEDSPVLHEGF